MSTRRWLPIAVVVVALFAIGLAAAAAHLDATDAPLPALEPQEQRPEAPAAEQEQSAEPIGLVDDAYESVPGWLATVLIALLVGVPTALVLAAVSYWIRVWLQNLAERPRGRLADQTTTRSSADASQVREAVQAGLADIDAADDPRAAIIACWLSLERAAADAGTPRMIADTPTDLVIRLLSAHQVDQRALGDLADAYRAARYAPATVTEATRDTARSALAAVDAQLSARVAERAETTR